MKLEVNEDADKSAFGITDSKLSRKGSEDRKEQTR